MTTKQKVVWLQDKGKNTIPRDEVIPDLLNNLAGWKDPNVKPSLIIEKEFSSPSMSIEQKLLALKPQMLKVECPLAAKLGLPIALYAYPEAKPGEEPTKGEPNMAAMLLARKLEDGSSRMIRGKALVCLEQSVMSNGSLDLPIDLLIKLFFFTADVVKDTVGSLRGAELQKKINDAPLFFQFYGPGRHVIDKMTKLVVTDPQRGPAGPKQVFTIEQLRSQVAEQNAMKMQGAGRGMPAFMQEPYMQDSDYLKKIKETIYRGWKAPSEAKEVKEDEGVGSASETDEKVPADELDFSDFN